MLKHGVYKQLVEQKLLVVLLLVRAKEANLVISALEIREKQVIELMIPIKSTFMIDYDEKLDKTKLKQIVDKGYSRIPVYANHNIQDMLGLVRIKQLIFC